MTTSTYAFDSKEIASSELVVMLKSYLDKGEAVPLEIQTKAVQLREPNGCTPLHIAAKEGYADVVKFLLDNKASRDSKWTQGGDHPFTDVLPLHLAVLNNHHAIAAYLLEKQSDMVNEKFGYDASFFKEYSEKNGKTDRLTSHLPQVKNLTPSHVAAYVGDAKTLLTLLINNADLTATSGGYALDALRLAKEMKQDHIVQILTLYNKIIQHGEPALIKSINMRIKQMFQRYDSLTVEKIILLLKETNQRIEAVDTIFKKAKLEEKQREYSKKSKKMYSEYEEKKPIERISEYHGIFIYLIKRKYYKERYSESEANEGVCQGLSVNAMLSMMQEQKNQLEIDHFNKRQDIIYFYFKDCFNQSDTYDASLLDKQLEEASDRLDRDIERVKDKVRQKDSETVLSEEEQLLLEIPSLIESTAVAFDPLRFTEIYPPDAKKRPQDIEVAISIMHPSTMDHKQVKKESSLVESPVPLLGKFSGIYNKRKLKLLIEDLLSQKEVIQLGEPLGFQFSNGGHMVSAMMNPKTKELCFFDSNGGLIKKLHKVDEMVDEVFAAYNNEELMGCFTQIFVNKKHAGQIQHVISNWKNSETFKLVHAVTTDSIQQRDDVTNASLLYLATLEEDFSKIQQLLSSGADPNAAKNNGFTPLHVAAQSGNIKIVEYLLRHNADPNFMTENGAVPLHAAFKNIDIVKLLLDHKADPNLMTLDGYTALYAATLIENSEIVNLLLENKANPNLITSEGDSPLAKAVLSENRQIIKLLLENNADPSFKFKKGFSLLMVAVLRGNLEIIRLLLECGANAKLLWINNILPLHFAVQENKLEIVNLLLDADSKTVNAEFTANFPELYQYASNNSRTIEFNQLFPLKDKPVNGFTPLHLAAYFGHFDILKRLLDRGADVSKLAMQTEGVGKSALEIAEAMGHREIANILREATKPALVDEKKIIQESPISAASDVAIIIQPEVENKDVSPTLVENDGAKITHPETEIETILDFIKDNPEAVLYIQQRDTKPATSLSMWSLFQKNQKTLTSYEPTYKIYQLIKSFQEDKQDNKDMRSEDWKNTKTILSKIAKDSLIHSKTTWEKSFLYFVQNLSRDEKLQPDERKSQVSRDTNK